MTLYRFNAHNPPKRWVAFGDVHVSQAQGLGQFLTRGSSRWDCGRSCSFVRKGFREMHSSPRDCQYRHCEGTLHHRRPPSPLIVEAWLVENYSLPKTLPLSRINCGTSQNVDMQLMFIHFIRQLESLWWCPCKGVCALPAINWIVLSRSWACAVG